MRYRITVIVDTKDHDVEEDVRIFAGNIPAHGPEDLPDDVIVDVVKFEQEAGWMELPL